MQYKIPQNVGIEDRIVGPLTLRQLIILAVGFGISYVLFAIISKLYELNFLEYAVILLPGLLSGAFALIKINDVPLTKFLFIFLEFSIKPKRRVWNHRGIASLVAPDLTQETAQAAPDTGADEKAKKAANLTELTKMLDSGGFEHVKKVEHADMDSTKDDDLVTQAYFGNKREQSATQNMYWRTKDSQLKRLGILASLPVTELKKGTKETAIAREQILKAKTEAEDNRKTSIENKKVQVPQKPQQAVIQTKQDNVKPKPAQTFKSSNQTPLPQPKPQPAKPVTPAKKENVPAQAKNPVKTLEKPIHQAPGQAQVKKKKPRKRNRPIPQPVRGNNQINTTNKNEPAKYIPGKTSDKPADKQVKKPDAGGKAGEFDFRELEKGEIEINLD